MAATVNTGWRSVTPGACRECGTSDEWQGDGRGNVLCNCQACPDCGLVDAYGFHEQGCPTLDQPDDGTACAYAGCDQQVDAPSLKLTLYVTDEQSGEDVDPSVYCSWSCLAAEAAQVAAQVTLEPS